MIRFIILFVFILVQLGSGTCYSQGYLMLAGGGEELAGGWSDAPYRWVVEHAQNKKIAVITYDSAPTEWIPNYFRSFGAKWVRNLIVNSRNSADMQWLYDSLITYNGVFIKGGDQSKYYDYYIGTKTQQALQYIYNNGGVLSGTSAGTAILSPIIYTAKAASVDPSTALLFAYTSHITLTNDFLTTLSNKYIFDTHVLERGRFGRIPSFMAKWYRTTKEVALGVGIDDQTALCITPDNVAEVFGTGSVGFYSNFADQDHYDTLSTMIRTKSMKLTQLLHGNSLNMTTGEIQGFVNTIQPPVDEENEKRTILFSGTDYPTDEAYSYFVNQVGIKSDPILIVTGSDLSFANGAKNKMVAMGAATISIVQALSANQNDPTIQTLIASAKKLFVIANDYEVFMGFLDGGSNGNKLSEKIRHYSTINFFIGDNGRFLGKTVVDRYKGFGYASYNGELEFAKGLGLLKSTAIMPNAFVSNEYIENTVSGLPYAMFEDSLKYGLYITGNTFAEYGYTPDNTSYFKNIGGSFPLIILKNNGTKMSVANHGPSTKSRNVAGFENLDLKFLAVTDTILVGRNVAVSANPIAEPTDFSIFPNPTKDYLNISAPCGSYVANIFDLLGRLVLSSPFADETQICIENFNQGIYIIRVNSTDMANIVHFEKIIVK